MEIIKLTGVHTAISPIVSLGDEKSGSTPTLRRIFIMTPDGEVQIPFIHGNSFRGRLRRIMMKNMLDELDYQIKNKKIYHALYSGGVLESTEDIGVVNLDLRLQIVDLLPPVSLLGTALGNQMISGKLMIGHLFPICREYYGYLPEDIQNHQNTKFPFRTFTDITFITRKDDLRAGRAEDEQAIQMKVEYEVFVPGTSFYHEVVLSFTNEVENSCFANAMRIWRIAPTIGGKGAIGEGNLRFGFNLENYNCEIYKQYLQSRKEEITKLLKKLENEC